MSRNVPMGWPLLPQPGPTGQLAFPVDLDASVRQSIRIILSTRPGELLMHPDFGAGLDQFIHDLDSLALRRAIQNRVTESLARWELRMDVDRVEVNDVPDQPSRLRVEIAYRLKRTGAPSTLGLTLATGA